MFCQLFFFYEKRKKIERLGECLYEINKEVYLMRKIVKC